LFIAKEVQKAFAITPVLYAVFYFSKYLREIENSESKFFL